VASSKGPADGFNPGNQLNCTLMPFLKEIAKTVCITNEKKRKKLQG
jgi:hypothetical protein